MSNIDLVSCCVMFTCSCFILLILLSLPIVEIVFGIQYYENLECQSQINIPIYLWLIIKGSFTILTIILVGCLYTINNKSMLFVLTNPCLYFLQLFNLVWLILGSIIFWRDCSNLKPESVNILLYVSLISGYISIFGSILNKSNSSNSSNNRFLVGV